MRELFVIALFTFIIVSLAHAQQPELVPVDEEISDEEVLQLVNTAHPGLEQFSAAMAAGDRGRATELLVAHFASREKPVLPPSSFPGLGSGNSTCILGGASQATVDEQWMKHVFTQSNNDIGKSETFDLGHEIRWMESPSKALSWTIYQNQLNVVNSVAGLYKQTGDEKYAAKAGEWVASWVKQCPAWYGGTQQTGPWASPMETRNRMCNCIAAYEVLRKSPSLTPEMHLAFLKIMITHSRSLMSYTGVAFPGLIAAAVMFPEFSEAGTWMEAGEACLRRTIVGRTTPDGAWDTHSISYQGVPVPWAGRSLEILEANAGTGDYSAIAEMIRTQAGKLTGAMLRIALPNCGLPNIGDTYGRSDWSNATSSFLAQYIYTQFSPDEQARLNAIEPPFERIKAALATSAGLADVADLSTSTALPASGYYVMRKSWEPLVAPSLYFDLSPQAMGHVHADACHVEMYAYGKPLVCDTGDYFLGWGYRTALHNTIEIDGAEQAWGAQMMPCEWLATEAFDFVDGAHAGYEPIGVTHRRKVFFARADDDRFGDYWVLADLLTGTGSHTYEQFFHFAGPSQMQGAEAEMDPSTLACRATHDNCPNAVIAPAPAEGLAGAFVEAQDTDMSINEKRERKAMLGWIVTGGTFQKAKSAVAVYTMQGEPPLALYDVLMPTVAGAGADISIEHLPVTQNGQAVDPAAAAGLKISCSYERSVRDPASIVMDVGENLAAGRPASAEINTNAFGAGTEVKLTDGVTGETEIAAAVSSSPYTPGVELEGRFAIDLGEPVAVNLVVAHHGTFNGSGIIYPPTEFSIEYWSGEDWVAVPNPDTTWSPNETTSTMFDRVTTSRIAVRVKRPEGGRLSMREIQVHHVPVEEFARVEALRNERMTLRWTDYVLLSHDGAKARSYGEFDFDGELAFIRTDADGKLVRSSVMHASALSRGGQPLVRAAAELDYLTARWAGDMVDVETAAAAGLEIAAVGASNVTMRGEAAMAELADGRFTLSSPAPGDGPGIEGLTVEVHPPQEGLAGGQPWADLRWNTGVPATTQVLFDCADGLTRRTILDEKPTTEHAARVEFLRPGRSYLFHAVSTTRTGGRSTEATAPIPVP